MGLFHKNLKTSSDADLVVLMGGGNTRAFDELYNRYSVKLLNYFRKMLNNDAEKAQDFLQDLFIKILEKSGYYDVTKSFSTWIYALACNMCKNEYRNHAIRSRILEENGEFIFYNEKVHDLENIDLILFNKHLKTELDRLDYAHRETFVLRFYEELSIKEISQVLDCAEGTVKSRLYYTLKKLGGKLASFNPAI
jgi:RNA polymerase sigma-70 factor (ECF subfamily)